MSQRKRIVFQSIQPLWGTSSTKPTSQTTFQSLNIQETEKQQTHLDYTGSHPKHGFQASIEKWMSIFTSRDIFFPPEKKHPSSFPVFFLPFWFQKAFSAPVWPLVRRVSFECEERWWERGLVSWIKKNGFPLNNARLGLGSDQCAISYRKETTVNTSPTLLVDSAHVKCQANQSLSLRRSLAVSFFGINKTWQRWLHCPLVPSLCFSVSRVFFTHTMLKTEAVGKIAYKAAAPTLSHNEWEPVKFHSPWIDKKFCDMKKKKSQ